MRLLCASNLHLGRSTYGVPDHLGLDPARSSMTATWDALVDLARTTPVDAVLIAGDLVDRENRRFEPIGPIERALTTLARHDIQVIVVAGDDDAGTVREIAERDTSGAFRVLGGDGTWETTTLSGKDGDQLAIAGWSMPMGSARTRPLDDLPSTQGDAVPDIVVLHGTPVHDGTATSIAPLPLDHLASRPARLWIAGAPIAPRVDHLDTTTVLSPGSPSALGPLDTGTHGVWLIDITGDSIDLHQLPVAPIRFDHVTVDLTGVETGDDAEARLIHTLQQTLDHAVALDHGNHLAACGIHLVLTGATAAYGDLPGRLQDLERTIDLHKHGATLAISSITNNTQPPIDLATLLERADPVGETARLINALNTHPVDDMPDPWRQLLQRTTTRLHGVHRSRVFASVAHDGEPDLETARSLLRREAWLTLDALVRQRGIDQEG